MKRSNRLVLLIGVFLAIVAFVGILLLSQGGGETANPDAPPTELPTVIARANIPLGAKIQANQVTTEVKPVDAREAGAFQDTSQVIGKIARQSIVSGAQITSATFAEAGSIANIEVPATKRAIAVQVDQVSGVGTVIKTGDFVDMVVGIGGGNFPVITLNPADDTFTVVSGLNATSVKVLIQGLQVLGTLLPPPPAEAEGGETTGESETALTGQQQIVILAVDAQQAEVIKFAQTDGSITLTLRSAEDFYDPATGQLLPDGPVPDITTGVILKSLVDSYGVLPPELIETVLPEQATPANP